MILELSPDEALVLFDLLADYARQDRGWVLEVHNAAERNALWALRALLERQLVESFQPDYAERVRAARARLEEQGGGW